MMPDKFSLHISNSRFAKNTRVEASPTFHKEWGGLSRETKLDTLSQPHWRGSWVMSAEKNETFTGRCLCGEIQFVYQGTLIETVHCHCESCRRHTSSPFSTFVVVDKSTFRYTKGVPIAYQSSPGVERTHCGRCGSPIAYETSAELALYACTLDDLSKIKPDKHVRVDEQLPWIEIADQLPRYAFGKRDAPVSIGPQLTLTVR
jgi:hypothetical protein